MSAPATTTDLLTLIHKSGIADPDSFAEKLGDPAALPPVPSMSAAVLVQRGLITKFQAKLLLTGRFRGFKLGPYVVQEHLGQGGMGAVYLAEHEALRRRVAVKVLTQPKGDQQGKLALERFLREARAAAALDHPNIVRVHDVSKQGDVHFLVLEYVEGQTLEQLTQAAGAVPPGKAVGLIAQAAAGLQHAFEKGFVHRDIKPANLMLTKDGTVKILDMGLARSLAGDGDKLTERMDEGAIVGTADFISPEQAMNLPSIDVRSDIYSLGATFFALVTGKPPFAGNTTQKLVQHQMKEPPSLDSIDRTVPPELAVVVGKMLAKRPEKRYQTPAEVITALAPWLTDDGATKIMAALSGSDLAGSVEMQNTLNELVQGGTTRIGKSKRLGGKKKPIGLWAGTAAALLIAAGLVGWMALGGSTAGTSGPGPSIVALAPGPRPATPKPSPSPARTQPVAAVVPAPTVPAPTAVPAAIYRFDPAIIPECRFTVLKYKPIAGVRPPLPYGYNLHCWKEGATGDFVREVNAGRPVLGLASRDGEPSAQFSLSLTNFVPDLAVDRDITATVEYLCRGTVGNVHVQNTSEKYAKLGSTKLDDSAGEWRTAEVTFRRPAGANVQLAINSEQSSADGMVYVRSIVVTDPPTQPVLYRFAAADVPPFENIKTGRNRTSGTAESKPTNVLLVAWNPNTRTEWARRQVDGAAVITGRTLTPGGVATLALDLEAANDPLVTLIPGRRYIVRVTYKADPKTQAMVYWQHLGTDRRTLDQANLPDTTAWRTVEVQVVRQATPLKVNIDTRGPNGLLYVREVSIVEAAGPAAGEASLFRLAAADIGLFRHTKTGFDTMTEGTSAALPPGVSFAAHKPDSRAEYFCIDADGGRALGWANLDGPTSAQIAVELESPNGSAVVKLAAGRKYVTRVTYKASRGGGTSYVQTHGDYIQVAGAWVDLPATDGQWRTVEYAWTKPAMPVRLLVDNRATGPDGVLLVREVTVSEAGTAAPPPPAVAAAPSMTTADGATLYTLDMPAKAFRYTLLDGRSDVPDAYSYYPVGVNVHCWKKESVADVRGEPTDVGLAIGLTNLNEQVSSQIQFNLENGIALMLKANQEYKVRLEYRTTGDAAGKVQARDPGPKYTRTGGTDLPTTGGRWRTAEFTFRRSGQKADVIVENTVVGEGSTLYVRKLELIERVPAVSAAAAEPPRPASMSAALFDPLTVPAFDVRFADKRMTGGRPTLPPGFGVQAYRGTTDGRMWTESIGGRPALGMETASGEAALQFLFDTHVTGQPPAVTAGRNYAIRVEYMTRGDGAGYVMAQTYGTWTRVAGTELPPTGGKWQSAEVRFAAGADPLRLAVNATKVGSQNTIYLGRFELVPLD